MIARTSTFDFWMGISVLSAFFILAMILYVHVYRKANVIGNIFLLSLNSFFVFLIVSILIVSSNSFTLTKTFQSYETDILMTDEKVIIDIYGENKTFEITEHIEYNRVQEGNFYVKKYKVYNIFDYYIYNEYILTTYDESN